MEIQLTHAQPAISYNLDHNPAGTRLTSHLAISAVPMQLRQHGGCETPEGESLRGVCLHATHPPTASKPSRCLIAMHGLPGQCLSLQLH